MSSCYINSKLEERPFKDRAFMGVTHAMSGVALFLGIAAFFPDFTEKALGSSVIWVIILGALVTAGAALLPDLDNTTSTAKNSLGPLGLVLSYIFRTSSAIIQTVIRTPRDDPNPNPHRGAWHTIPAAALLGFLTYLGTKIGGSIELPLIGEITGGGVFALIIAFLMTHLALSGLANSFMKKIKKSSAIGELIALAISFTVTASIFINIPADVSFWWLGVSVGFGMFVHILGDSMTTAGVPILFPLSAIIKGKFWWTTRFLGIKAGGVVENTIFLPGFTILTIVSIVKILIDM